MPEGRLSRDPLAEARNAAGVAPGRAARSGRPGDLRHGAAARTRLRPDGRALGWIGKNTCLIDRKAGSFTVLGSLLVDIELAYDAPVEDELLRDLHPMPRRLSDRRRSTAPYQLDARRCISYWTIEHKGPIPDPEAESLDGWAFGCDVCQDVCPWNRKAPAGSRTGRSTPDRSGSIPDLIGWLARMPRPFSKSLKGTALARSKRSGLLRNAALILGARRVVEAVPVLIDRLNDPDPVIRGASAWALGRIGSNDRPSRPSRMPRRRDLDVRTAGEPDARSPNGDRSGSRPRRD